MEMSATIRPTRLVLVFMLLMMIGARVDAQDVVKVSPDTVKVILENDQVRVIESTIPPGTLQAKHSHPATIVYYLTASKVKSEGPDGKLVVTERKAGDVGRAGHIKLLVQQDLSRIASRLDHGLSRQPRPHRVGADDNIGHQSVLPHQLSHPRPIPPATLIQRSLMVIKRRIAPARLRVPENEQGLHPG